MWCLIMWKEGKFLDAPLMANRAIDPLLNSNTGASLCKLGIKKVYGHVNWNLLLCVLQKMCCSEKLID